MKNAELVSNAARRVDVVDVAPILERRSCHAMDRSIDTSASSESRVGGTGERIGALNDNVADNKFKPWVLAFAAGKLNSPKLFF